MPYLRKLYATENLIEDKFFEGIGPISAPMTFIDLSNNKLRRIPNLGPTADLQFLNVSYNYITKLDVDDLAQYCSLMVIDLRNNAGIVWDKYSCDCHLFLSWINERKIDAKYDFKCPKLDRCRNETFSNDTLVTWQNCTRIIETKELAKKARSTWILIASCIATFCACIVIVLCCIHKRNKKRRLRLKEEQKVATNMQTTELLHGQNTT